MFNPIVFQFMFGIYTVIAACSWQPIMQYPQMVGEYRVNCMVSMRAPGTDPRLWVHSGVLRGPFVGSGEDLDIPQETY